MLFRREAAAISKLTSSLRSVVVWAAQIALCLTSGVSGAVELSVDPATLASMGVTWAGDSPQWFVRSVGTAELAGAIGIAAAALIGIMPRLTVVAASSLVGADVLAMSVHASWSALTPPAPLGQISLALSLVVLWTSRRRILGSEQIVGLQTGQHSEPKARS